MSSTEYQSNYFSKKNKVWKRQVDFKTTRNINAEELFSERTDQALSRSSDVLAGERTVTQPSNSKVKEPPIVSSHPKLSTKAPKQQKHSVLNMLKDKVIKIVLLSGSDQGK